MNPVVNLHGDAKVLAVRHHNHMRYSTCLGDMVEKTPPPRNVRKDLHKLESKVHRYEKEPLDQETSPAGLSSIQTDAVTNAINNDFL